MLVSQTNTCTSNKSNRQVYLLRKEVIHPQLPLRMPCYDFNPVNELAFHTETDVLGPLQFPGRDGQCVQNPRTYSPRRG